MNSRIRHLFALILAAVIGAAPVAARAQTDPARVSDAELQTMVDRVEAGTDRFANSLEDALEADAHRGTPQAAEIRWLVETLERSADRLKEHADGGPNATDPVIDLFRSAIAIDAFMRRTALTPAAHARWSELRSDLLRVATAFNLGWNWQSGLTIGRVSDDQVDAMLDTIEGRSAEFRASLVDALERRRLIGTLAEDDVLGFVRDFDAAIERWSERYGDETTASAAAAEVLNRAVAIDAFMRTHRLSDEAQEDWALLRRTLDRLGMAYGLGRTW